MGTVKLSITPAGSFNLQVALILSSCLVRFGWKLNLYCILVLSYRWTRIFKKKVQWALIELAMEQTTRRYKPQVLS